MILALVLAAVTAVDPWALMAERDVRAMHDQLRDHHPGPVDPLNPKFNEWLEQGLAQSLERARAAKSYTEYANALRFYAAGFRDGHLGVFFSIAPTSASWPRFILGRRGDAVVVTRVAEGEQDVPPVGSVLLDCDGALAREMIERELIPLHAGPLLESTADVVAPLLLQRGKFPKQCRFSYDNKTMTHELRYRRMAADALAKLRQPEPAPTGVRRVAGGVWVSIPSFQGADAATAEALRKLVEAAPSWRDAPFVVFDVRGNEGGNSSWGVKLLYGLYGEPFLNAALAGKPGTRRSYADWRVSADNLAMVRDNIESVTAQLGPEARHTLGLKAVEKGMVDALAQGKALLHFNEDDYVYPERTEPIPAPEFNGKVVLLTDGRCASACLDFADHLYRLPNFTHAGRTTSADSVYMETRSVTLPSGMASLSIPTKVYRNRVRGHNEPYTPHWQYEGDVSDTAAVEKWIVGRLGADREARRSTRTNPRRAYPSVLRA
jgi:Peptidase family S41